jgi:uncharacterized membrane protein YfcA
MQAGWQHLLALTFLGSPMRRDFSSCKSLATASSAAAVMAAQRSSTASTLWVKHTAVQGVLLMTVCSMLSGNEGELAAQLAAHLLHLWTSAGAG